MMYLLGVLIMAFGVALSIALHEIGHLVPAKKFRVKVTQYMVGFGPTIWSRRRGETEYGVKAIPLGGYVRMIGMFPPRPKDGGRLRASSTGRWSQMADQARAESMEEIGPGDEDRVFYKLPVWQRIIVMFGGPLMNLAIATVLLTGILVLLGLPQGTARISMVSECAPTDVTVTDCAGQPASPALLAGLQEGDVIEQVNGVPVASWSEASYAIQNSPEQATFVVNRDGQMLELPATLVERERPVYTADGTFALDAAGEPVMEPRRYFGASGSIEYVAQPISEAPAFVGGAVVDTARIFLKLPEKLVGVYQAAFGDQERDAEGPMSVVGVGRVAGEVTDGSLGALTDSIEGKAAMLLSLLASLNIALFVFNMVPLLPLDGGHIAGALWEGVKKGWARVRGRPEPHPVDIAKALPVAYTVAIALIGMTLLLVYADLVNPIRLAG
ncbi:M50 family metallopeptidase [Ornithinimicrobium cryptoxanthini]|uniref:Site-2 protease family protein n=1 Tax=Ornithinimicrobium cryptoxanthini TaxID=2934161 RepID=A0ABY4YEZ5_9MICO|nr:site-2 protease family protein [Ornithinimicrobium cryptoxanthini]USQ75169.1 site-2 protease family protein [Ornithinimicrobium cryptoxanthini]